MISEGFVNYFNLPSLQEICKRIAKNLKECPFGGVYIFDIMILPSGDKYKQFNQDINQSIELFSSMLNLKIYFPYESLTKLKSDLLKCGFYDVEIINSANNEEIKSSKITTTNENGLDYVHIIIARAK